MPRVQWLPCSDGSRIRASSIYSLFVRESVHAGSSQPWYQVCAELGGMGRVQVVSETTDEKGATDVLESMCAVLAEPSVVDNMREAAEFVPALLRAMNSSGGFEQP